MQEHILEKDLENLVKSKKYIKYIINQNNCWECTSHDINRKKKDYIRIGRFGKGWYMHRYVYTIYNGEIPDNMVVMHTCDNTRCINPEHLKLGTQLDNVKDMDDKGRRKYKAHHGADNPSSKHSKEKCWNIKKDLDNGISAKEVIKKYNVSGSLVSNIKTGKHWIFK